MRKNWPIISNLDPPPGHIINRAGPLARLEKHFKTNSTTVISHKISPINDQHQVISGLGGIGKTQLARSYAWLHRHEYQVIWWCRAEDKTVLLQDLRELITKLNSQHDPNSDDYDPAAEKILAQPILLDGLSEDKALEKIQALFKRLDNILLILDNVEEESVVDIVPVVRLSRSHAVITSRNRNFGKFRNCVLSLGVFEESEALALLQNYVKENDESFSDQEKIVAKELAHELGYLALALNQAGAFMQQRGIGLREYLKIFREKFEELSKQEKHPDDYPETMFTTWILNLEAVKRTPNIDPKLIEDFLGCISYLSPDAISKKFLKRLLNVDDLILGRVLEVCGKYSLVDFQAQNLNVSVHRLVQKLMRSSHSSEQARKCIEKLTYFIHDDLERDRSQLERESYQKQYFEYLEALEKNFGLKKWQDLGQEQRRGVECLCLFRLCRITAEVGRLSAAEEIGKRALVSLYGREDDDLAARTFNVLGNVYCDLGNMDKSKFFYKKSLRIRKKLYGVDDWRSANILNNLAIVYGISGNFVKKKEMSERALVLLEGHYGRASWHLASALNNLSLVAIVSGDEEVNNYFKRIQEIGDVTYFTVNICYLLHINENDSALKLLLRSTQSPFSGLINFNQAYKGFVDDFLKTELENCNVVSIIDFLLLRYLLVVCYVRLSRKSDAENAFAALKESSKKFPESEIVARMIAFAESKIVNMRRYISKGGSPMPKIDFTELKTKAEKISSSTVKKRMAQFLEDAETKFSAVGELSLAQVKEFEGMINKVRDDLGEKLSRSKTGQAILEELDEYCRQAKLKVVPEDSSGTIVEKTVVVSEKPSFHKMLIREVSEAASSEQQIIITLDNLVNIADELAVLRLRLIEVVEANLQKSKREEHEQWRVTQLVLEGNAPKLQEDFKNKDHLLNATSIRKTLGDNTPLMLACLFGWVDVVRYYEKRQKTKSSLKNCLGMSAGHLAVIGGQAQILEILGSNLPNLEMKTRVFNEQVIDCDLLALAVLLGNREVVEKLLSFPEHQNSLKTARPYGNILHLAVLANRRSLLAWLLQHNLVREANLFNQEGVYENIGGKKEKFTPLALAVFLGHLEVMKLILSFPRDIVDINAGSQLMPVNFAVMAFNSSALRILIKRGADLNKLNANNQTVGMQLTDLQSKDSEHESYYEDMIEKVAAAARGQEVKQYRGVLVKPKRIENLIFRGGGIKGVAYAGALLALTEQLKDSNYPEYSFPNIERVGGTSAGALTAFLVGMGKSASNIGEELQKFPFDKILETVSGRATQGISPGKPAKKDISKIGSALEFALAAFETAVRQGHMLELVIPLLDFEGLSTGEKLKAELTKILLGQRLGEEGKLFTFGQWRKLVESDPKKYKHIHIVTSCIKGPNPGCHIFHSEKPEQAERGVYDDVVIVDAVAASMAFPAAFMPQKIRCVASDGTPYDFNQGAEYLDGGILMNYPIGIFDQRGFTDPFNIYADKKYPDVNKSTLGFTLVDPSDAEQGTSLLSKIAAAVRKHSNLVDRLSAIVSFYMHAEAYFAKIRMPDDFRTVEISNLGYKTSDVVIDDAQKGELAGSGRKAVEDFFAGVRQSDAPKVSEEAKSHRERSKWEALAAASPSVSPAPALPVVEAKKPAKKEGKAPRPKK